MKIKKLTRYREPKYPTLEQVQDSPELLQRIPRRWSLPSRWVLMVSAATLLSRQLSAGDPPKAKPNSTLVPGNRPTKANDPHKNPKAQKGAMFAPILNDALQNDGRGAFGCVVMNPPTFLPESEALELIHNELVSAGLKLKEDVPVSGLQVPNPENKPWRHEKGNGMIEDKYFFDYVSEDGEVVIEFLSETDHKKWDLKEDYSSVSAFDFPATVERMKKAFGRYKGERKIFGLFFDPLVHSGERGAPLTDISDVRLREAAMAEKDQAAMKFDPNAKAKEKLRQQVAHFVTYLKKIGKLPAVTTQKK